MIDTSSTTENNSPAETPTIPRADIDLRDVARSVSKQWLINPGLTLLWLTRDDFDTNVENYSTLLTERKSTGGTRPEYTGLLKNLDKTVNGNLYHIKDYLVAKYTSRVAPSYYASFGMVKVGKSYKLPVDRNNRLEALGLLVSAITTEGFQANEFGLAYWTDIQTKYTSYLTHAFTIDGTVSNKVGNKNVLKKEIRKGLNAIINLIKANYPDTYKTELREWGFQKEKY